MGYMLPTMERPSQDILEEWLTITEADDSWNFQTLATDGCKVTPYSFCEHEHCCWLLYLGYT